MLLDDIATRVRGASDLPGLSATCHKLLRMISDPEITMQRIAAVVALDPPLAASVMRVANSAAYGFNEPTKDLGTALTRIGLRMLRTLAVASSVLRSAEKLGGLRDLDRNGYWRHCLGAAVGARHVAQLRNPHHDEDAFLAALLHGIGLTVLDVFFPDLLRQVLQHARETQSSLSDALYALRDVHLSEISALIMREWDMDAILVDTVRGLHLPSSELEGDRQLLHSFVRTGIALASTSGIGLPLTGTERELDALLEVAIMDEEDWAAALTRVEQNFRVFEGLAGARAA